MKAPVAPTGSYQNPDGSITYVYPTEVIEKYMSQPPRKTSTGSVAAESNFNLSTTHKNYTVALEGPERAHPLYATPSTGMGSNIPRYHYPHAPHLPFEMNSPVNVPYPNYPALPPPPSEMPQGTFIFNQQGVVQRVEPTGYNPTNINGNSQLPGANIGLAQVAAAVMVNSEQQASPLSMRPTSLGPAVPHAGHYMNPVAAPSYYHPTGAYPSTMHPVGGPVFTPMDGTSNNVGGNRANSRRRGSYHTNPKSHFVNPSIQAGSKEDGNGRFSIIGGEQVQNDENPN